MRVSALTQDEKQFEIITGVKNVFGFLDQEHRGNFLFSSGPLSAGDPSPRSKKASGNIFEF